MMSKLQKEGSVQTYRKEESKMSLSEMMNSLTSQMVQLLVLFVAVIVILSFIFFAIKLIIKIWKSK